MKAKMPMRSIRRKAKADVAGRGINPEAINIECRVAEIIDDESRNAVWFFAQSYAAVMLSILVGVLPSKLAHSTRAPRRCSAGPTRAAASAEAQDGKAKRLVGRPLCRKQRWDCES